MIVYKLCSLLVTLCITELKMDLPILKFTEFHIKDKFFVLPTIIRKQWFVEFEIAIQSPLTSVKMKVLGSLNLKHNVALYTFRQRSFLASRKDRS